MAAAFEVTMPAAMTIDLTLFRERDHVQAHRAQQFGSALRCSSTTMTGKIVRRNALD
jgi:hypothetical protein